MAKTGLPVSGPAGLADWLPLLGAICQVLASVGEEDEIMPGQSAGSTKSRDTTPERLQAGEKRGR